MNRNGQGNGFAECCSVSLGRVFPVLVEQVERIGGSGRAGANTLYKAAETNDGGVMEREVFPTCFSMIAIRCASLALLVVALTGSTGCKPKEQPDPLVGWKKYGSTAGFPATDTGYRLNPEIMANYRAYIDALPEEERALAKSGAELYFCEDGTGQHAVEIVIPLNGTYWTHVLVYDKSNKRIKSMKFRSGRYAC